MKATCPLYPKVKYHMLFYSSFAGPDFELGETIGGLCQNAGRTNHIQVVVN